MTTLIARSMTGGAPLLLMLCVCADVSAEFNGSINFSSDYISRGYRKSDGNPAVRANLDYEHNSGLYLGAWASSVDFGDNEFKSPSSVEVIPYLGWTFELSDDWRLDTQVARYIYDGRIFNNSSDYNEFYFLLHYRDWLSAHVAFSEDGYNRGHMLGDYGLSGRFAVTDVVQLSAGVGFTQAKEVLDYNYLYWDFGLTWFHPYGGLDFRYVQSKHFGEENQELRDAWLFEPDELGPTMVFTITFGF